MSDQQEKKSRLGGCVALITAIAALLTALGANQIIPELVKILTGRPSPPPTSSGPPFTPSPPQPPKGCVLIIKTNNIPLISEPDLNSQQLASLKPGTYNPLDYRSVNSYGLLKEGWFQIESEGQRGWIQDNSWIISSKRGECSY
jgi:hypothetical protein